MESYQNGLAANLIGLFKDGRPHTASTIEVYLNTMTGMEKEDINLFVANCIRNKVLLAAPSAAWNDRHYNLANDNCDEK